jgi:hypothetical protein
MSREVVAGSKVVRMLVREFRQGYRLVGASGKYNIEGPDGQLVRKPGGMPYGLPNSPHLRNGREVRLRNDLRKLGVID